VIFVYSVKSYCVLKISENKEEIRYILKFYYKKRKNAIQAAKKICDVYGHDAASVHKAGSSVFNLEIYQRCTLWSTNHWKSRWNHGKSWARPAY